MHNINSIMPSCFQNLKNNMIENINKYLKSANQRLDKFEKGIKKLKKNNIKFENKSDNNKKHNSKKFLSK